MSSSTPTSTSRSRAARRQRQVSASPPALAEVDPEAPIDEAELFYAAVWDEVRRIPYGEVTTYGWIAKRLGHPRHSRMVGQALKWLPRRLSRADDDQSDPDTLVPWHRVLNSSGKISLRGSPDAEALQVRLLRNEGVEVTGGGRGTGDAGRISLTTYGYFPALTSTSSDASQESETGPTRRRGRR